METPKAEPPRDPDSAAAPRTGGQVARLRLAFLAPLAAVIVTAVAAFIVGLYYQEKEYVRHGVVHLHASVLGLYEDTVRDSARALRALMDVLARDEPLRAALARRDRAALLARAAPILQDLRREYGITHLYFTRPDLVNLLRVHRPERHGDVIDRFTTLSAERRAAPAHGVELGPLGLFTLRVVAPWRDARTRRLLGYVELGMEIDHVLEHIREILGVEVFVLVDKRYLQRRAWEEGTRALGRTPDWDRLPDVVVSLHGRQVPVPALMEHFARHDQDPPLTLRDLIGGPPPQRAAFVPLQDAAGRAVGEMALLVDLSHATFTARQALYAGSATALLTGGGLFAFFFWLIGRIGRRLERDERELERLAVRDGLTGLYNYRMCYRLLDGELARARRFKHPVTLLMLDLDRFKQVNDRYGHIAGDRILESLGRLLPQALREVDSVCRYGGEEFGVILPVTGADKAVQVAERLRTAVQDAVFEVGDDRRVALTVSIGVATFPEHATLAQELVAAADRALYAAKQEGRNGVRRYQAALAAAAES